MFCNTVPCRSKNVGRPDPQGKTGPVRLGPDGTPGHNTRTPGAINSTPPRSAPGKPNEQEMAIEDLEDLFWVVVNTIDMDEDHGITKEVLRELNNR